MPIYIFRLNRLNYDISRQQKQQPNGADWRRRRKRKEGAPQLVCVASLTQSSGSDLCRFRARRELQQLNRSTIQTLRHLCAAKRDRLNHIKSYRWISISMSTSMSRDPTSLCAASESSLRRPLSSLLPKKGNHWPERVERVLLVAVC